MKHLSFFILSFIFILLLTFVGFAYDGPFYVATNGNDANDGSAGSPFKTIQHAADVMSTNVANPICYIAPGIYIEQVDILSNKNSGYMVFTSLSNNNPGVLDGNGSTNFI